VKLTLAQLRIIMPRLSEEKAAFWLPYLNGAMCEYDITTPARAAMWLANVAHETVELSKLRESLYYTTAARIRDVWPSRFKTEDAARPYLRNPEKLAEKVYGGRKDLGNTQPGDGWRFIGRGAPHLTGRDAYARAGEALGLPLLDSPELLEHPAHACRVAGWFWRSKGMDEAADAGNTELVRRKWAGGTKDRPPHGLAEVTAYEKRARAAMASPGG
jgi:putative chitinase